VHAITDRLEDHPTVTRNYMPQDGVVAYKRRRHCLGMLLPQLRAPFDIRKTEGEHAGRECRCGTH